MGKVFEFFTALLGKISALASWLLAVVKQVFIDIALMLRDVVCWFMESVLGIAVATLDLIEIPFDPQSYYSLIPPDVVNMLGALGITQCLTIIVAALVVRFILQTIPFVRWGS